MGMRWTHILGDAFSATECINMWGKIVANQTLPPHSLDTPPTTIVHQSLSSHCRSVELLDPLGDNWLTPNNLKMHTHTFHITEKKLTSLLSKGKCKYENVEPFEVISAVVWKSMVKIKEAKTITVCKRGRFDHRTSPENELPSNTRQVIGTVEAQEMSLIKETDLLEVAEMIAENFFDETSLIEKRIEEGNGNLDFVVYGANLTFVNLEGVNLYGLELKGKEPVFADLSIGGMGDGGAVLVFPYSGQGNGGGKIVNVILPEDQLQGLKDELSVDWGIF